MTIASAAVLQSTCGKGFCNYTLRNKSQQRFSCFGIAQIYKKKHKKKRRRMNLEGCLYNLKNVNTVFCAYGKKKNFFLVLLSS